MDSLGCFILCVIFFVENVSGLLLIPPFKGNEIQFRSEIMVDNLYRSDERLMLTPYLEENKYVEAQQLAKVSPSIGNVTSYSGFFTVNKTCDSNLFFWLFPAQLDNWENSPVLFWLQGGPGASSMFGLFEEIGPFEYTEEGFKKRKYSWNTENNLLIIDQPVGVGYSFTRNMECYPRDEERISTDLYSALIQFFELFPSLKGNKFFISGESYAGHYIPALGHAIHTNNPSAKVKINLTAMMIGNGLSDPATQTDYGSYLYQIGLIDERERQEFKLAYDTYQRALAIKNWIPATYLWLNLIGTLFDKYVGDVSRYNYVKAQTLNEHWEELVQTPDIRKALHAGAGMFSRKNSWVYRYLLADISKSVKPWVEELLEHYPIIFYYGQLDIVCGYPMAENFFRSISWSGQSQYLNAKRSQWCEGKDQAGYFKGEHRLYEILVRNAGHMVPSDQPQWAYSLMSSVTSGSPDNPLHALKSCKN